MFKKIAILLLWAGIVVWPAVGYGGDFASLELEYRQIVASKPGTDEALNAQEKLACLYVAWAKQPEADAAYQELLANYSQRAGIAEAVDHVADAYRKIENFQKARQCDQYIVDQWPDADHAAEAQAGVVRASILMGDEIGAQAAMNKLLSSFASSTHVAKAVDNVADDYHKAGQYEKSRQWYQYVVDHWPQDEHALKAQKGVVISNIVLGDQTAAHAAVDKLISDFNSNAEEIADTIDNVADDYRYGKMTNYIKAKQLYQYIATSWPTAEYAVEAQGDVVRCSILLGDEAGAQAAIDKLLADFGGHKNAAKEVDQLANLYRERMDYIKARDLYQYIVTNWPTTNRAVNAQGRVADCCILLGDETGAQAAYDKLLADFGGRTNVAKAVDHVANAYRAMRNYTKAKQLYQHIATSWPTAEYAVKTQSDVIRCSILLGDEAGAQAAYDGMLAAFGNHPRLPESMYFVAEEYIKRGMELENSTDLVGAQQYYRKGLVILEKILNDFPPTSYTPEVCYIAGDTYFRLADYANSGDTDLRLADYTNSLECFQKVTKDYPGYEYAWHAQFMLGRSYEGMMSLGHLSEAKANPLISAAYEELIEKYPTCQSVEYAQDWLDKNTAK